MHAPQIDQLNGLSAQDAAQRLTADGPNELSPPQRRGFWKILREVASEPMLQLLVAAGMIYLLLGDRGEALMLLAFVAVTLIISISQEHRTERVLQALRDLTSPRALVLRDGRAQRIAGLEVVCGDLLLLTEGDRVAADARLIEANDLETDESLLSGESLPIPKHVSATTEIGCVFAGSMVVAGQGMAEVIATGASAKSVASASHLARSAIRSHRCTSKRAAWCGCSRSSAWSSAWSSSCSTVCSAATGWPACWPASR